jgi:hypothetical protein
VEVAAFANKDINLQNSIVEIDLYSSVFVNTPSEFSITPGKANTNIAEVGRDETTGTPTIVYMNCRT